jgi:hypothetical protein
VLLFPSRTMLISSIKTNDDATPAPFIFFLYLASFTKYKGKKQCHATIKKFGSETYKTFARGSASDV